MEIKRAIELMEIEQKCIKRANTCNRDCTKCDLVQKDTDLLEAYELIIACATLVNHQMKNFKEERKEN